jgi:hypothetical protein
MTGYEKNLRNMIAALEQKILASQSKLEKYKDELNLYIAGLPKPPKPDTRDYCGKILYTSEKAAHAARRLINRDLRKAGKPEMPRAYFCVQCEAWHLTTKSVYNPPSNAVS